MVPGSRGIFIVGFERCMTSSLAEYLVTNGYCDLLVPGIKEPSVFSSDPALATALVERHVRNSPTRFLDASVNYAHDRKALQAMLDTVEDYRIIVCKRARVDRTVSAYKLYRGRYTLPSTLENLHDPRENFKYGSAATRAALASDPLAPPYLKRAPIGRYFYTNLWVNEIGDSGAIAACDASLELLTEQSLPERVLYELRYCRRTGDWPPASILCNSYYARVIETILEVFDRHKVMIITLDEPSLREYINLLMADFIEDSDLIEAEMAQAKPFPHVHSGGRWLQIPQREVDVARTILEPSFQHDQHACHELGDKHGRHVRWY